MGILSIQHRIGVAKPYAGSPQHHVIYYYQSYRDLSPLINNLNPATGKPYVTDINVAMFHLGQQSDGGYIHANDSKPDDPSFSTHWKQLAQLQKMGVKVFLVVGGNPPCCPFQSLFNGWNTVYSALQKTLKDFHFDGVDLDVEDPVDLSLIQRLIDQLSADFGSGFLITLDPVGTDVTLVPGQGMAGFNYKDLYKSPVGPKIAWFNVQFYNGWGNFSSTSDYDKAVANGFPPDKVVANMLCNQFDGRGYVDINTVANSVVKPLVQKYKNFAGVACWEYYNAEPGGTSHPEQWSKIMTQAMGLPTTGSSGPQIRMNSSCQLVWGSGSMPLDAGGIADRGLTDTLQGHYNLSCTKQHKSCQLVLGSNGGTLLNLDSIKTVSPWIYNKLVVKYSLKCS
jgi:hypothetical protein